MRTLLLAWLCSSLAAQNPAAPPRFEDYPAGATFTGVPAEPILRTPEQRTYRTRITNGAMRGVGVFTDGKSLRPIGKAGPNFAGHYVVIQWGCGSQCVMMAIVDLKTGKVYDPPLSGVGSELHVPLDNMSDMETDYRPDSTLMVLRNACRVFRAECGTYYFNLKADHFELVRLIR